MSTYAKIVVLALTLLLSACASTPAADPTPVPTLIPPSTPLSDELATELMFSFLIDHDEATRISIEQILTARDTRFTSVFIELMRAAQIGLVGSGNYLPFIEALAELTQQNFGPSWPEWVEWYGATDLQPPPGFTSWKGLLLGGIDPGFTDFLQDDFVSEIRVEEIQWGGVRVDGIPALDNPAMLEADKASYLNPEDPVFGLFINGEARAYPLRIMDWHEMANDVVGGVPVSLAYCTLCGAAIAFDGRAPNGETYTFGSSGFLYRSNKLMYDRQTRTLWNHLTGEPVLGQLAGQDLSLNLHSVVLTSWLEWQNQHPNTLVLDDFTGFQRIYEPGAAYGNYFASDETMFPVWNRNELLAEKEQIFALRIDGVPKAYPLDLLTTEEVANDVLADSPIVLIATRGAVQVDGESLREGEVQYQAGAEVRAFARADYTFSPTDDPDQLADQNGDLWQITEEALIGPNGETLERVPGHLAYWFGWFSFFPNTLVYGETAP